jgi:uncharacterized protein
MTPMTGPRTFTTTAGRHLLFALGCVLLVIGIAGLVLPLLPGTIFLILAAACFARSSPRFEHWLVTHPRFGPSVVAWRETGTIPVRAKIIAISMMAVSFALTWLAHAPPIALAFAGAGLSAAAIYVGTRPS